MLDDRRSILPIRSAYTVQKRWDKVQYSFIDKPVIHHQGENLVVKTEAIEVVYPFGDVYNTPSTRAKRW